MIYDKRRTKVEINGKEYTIVGEKSTAHVKLVVDTINNQIDKLKTMSSSLSTEEQAILVAVNAVSDQIEIHQKMIELETQSKDN